MTFPLNMTPPAATPDVELPAARAYVYCGDWVADCPRKGCANVEFLYRQSRMNGPRDQRIPFYTCSYCGAKSPIDWPRRENEIMQVLVRRAIPQNRNWYPKDHEVAIKFRIPHGQSVDDLKHENEEHGVT